MENDYQDPLNVVINEDHLKAIIDELRLLNFNWTDIAYELSLNSKWIQRWRQRYAYEDPREVIYDDQLDMVISSICTNHPETGEMLI